MKPCNLLLLAANSLLWLGVWSGVATMPALAESRPHYGGTLRVAMKEAPQTLDPAAAGVPASISRMVFETLVALDERGRPQPLLATLWQSDLGNQRWRFFIRGGVSFSDGSPLDSVAVAASLHNSNPQWKVSAAADMVMIETESADPDLPAELALERNSIVRRSASGGKLSGTGPFVIAQWDAGKHVSLTANEQYWAGRPFLDSVQLDLGKNDHDQMLSLDLAKADVVEVAPESIHRERAENRMVMTSEPVELMALFFAHDPSSEDETHARNALALSIDTAAVNNVVLQGGGEPSGALLPNWISGYAFVFSAAGYAAAGNTTAESMDRARQERAQAKHVLAWTLGFDASDAVARVIAERVLLNARDAGITLQLISGGSPDLRLVRIPPSSSDPHVVLAELAKVLQLPQPHFENDSTADLYSAEKVLLQSHRVIPLLHLRSAVAQRSNVHDLNPLPDGTWSASNVWLSGEKP
jgi:peptide/nickel transport system substrate-binding protein